MTSERSRSLLLTLTISQRATYERAIKEISRELTNGRKQHFVLRDAHKLFVVERVITGRAVDINEALLSVEPNPLQ